MKQWPVTDCEACFTAELNTWQMVIEIFRPKHVSYLTAHSSVVSAMLGGEIRTWYDKHRQRYIDKGERIELERMLRHVNI